MTKPTAEVWAQGDPVWLDNATGDLSNVFPAAATTAVYGFVSESASAGITEAWVEPAVPYLTHTEPSGPTNDHLG